MVQRMADNKRITRALAPFGVALLLLIGGWLWLAMYTRHDAKVEVPAIKGLTMEEAVAALEGKGLRAEVIDSVYNDEVPHSTVVDQDPKPGRTVKPDRIIFLVMNASQPKMLNMPQLVNLSKRQAMSVLDILGIKVKELQYRPDPCVDCVVAQLYQGKPIKAEERIRKGEAITLVLGSGAEGEPVQVPDVVGLAFAEVKATLNMASLNVGVVVECPGCNTSADTALARVVRQSPEAFQNNTIGAGGMIDVWLSMDPEDVPEGKRNEKTTNEPDTTL